MSELLRISHAIEAISQNPNGDKALEILSIITYFAPKNISTQILSSLVIDGKELGGIVRVLKRYSFVYLAEDQTQIRIDENVQKIMISMLRAEKKELNVITKALVLLFMQGINSINLEHVMFVWSYVNPYPKLITKFCSVPSLIITELKDQQRYEEGIEFGWKAIDLVIKVIGKSDTAMWVLQHNMAQLLGMAGKHKKSLEVLLPLYDHNVDNSGFRYTLIAIARQLGEMSRYREAFEIYQDTLFLNKKVSDSNDDQMLSAWHDYAHILSDTGKYNEASKILKEILKMRKKIVDTEDEDTLSLRSSLAHVLVKKSQYSEALGIFSLVNEVAQATLGPDHMLTLKSKRDMALVFQHQGKLDEALAIYEAVTEKFKQELGLEHTETLAIQGNIATLYQQRGEYQKALDTYKYIYKKQSKLLGEKHAEPLQVKYHIATILFIQEKHDEALTILQEVYTAYIEVFGPNHPKTLDLKTTLETLDSVKLETIYSAAWEGDLKKIKLMIRNGIDINTPDFGGKTPLHYAAESGHTSVVKLLLEKGAIYNNKSKEGKTPLQITNNSDIKNLLTLVANLIKDAREGNYEQVSKHIAKERGLVNAKDNDGSNAMHWATYNGHKDIVKLLVENRADATQVTNKGNTPLHIATSKGHKEIVELLLSINMSCGKILDFINARTTIGGVTSIHVAAKNGSLDIVKTLLKHGSIYNIKNKQGKTPMELSKDQNITNLLKLCDEFFQDAKNGNPDIISKTQCKESDEFVILINARNAEGKTLLQVLITNKHENIASKFLEMVKKHDETELSSGSESSLLPDQIKKVKSAAESHLQFSEEHSTMRRFTAPPFSPENVDARSIFKAGFQYLENACKLVEVYKACVPGLINDKNIQAVNLALAELGFDRGHITEEYIDEAYNGRVKGFVSNIEGTNYYKSLTSKSYKDVELFLEMIDRRIDVPVKRFLKSLDQKAKTVGSEKLFKAIEDNDCFEVEVCIREGVDVDLKNSDGGAPLHHAVNNGNRSIVNCLLKYGADVTQVTSKGNTPLHIATSKKHTEIVEDLLEHINCDELNDLVNAQTTVGGTTSLHVATKNGSIDIVKSLLRHGAIFNIKNKEGKVPIDISRHQNITNLLEIANELFQAAKIGILDMILELQSLQPDEFVAIKNSRNNQGHTLLQVAIINKHKNVESKLLEMYKKRNEIDLSSSPIFSIDQFRKLTDFAIAYIHGSIGQLPKLRIASCLGKENSKRWITMKDGSYYLENAYRLVEEYKKCTNGVIDDKNIREVNYMLIELQFDPKYNSTGYTEDAHGGERICFVSTGQGKRYYELTYSKSTDDLKLFLNMVERNIDLPVKKFLDSIKDKLLSVFLDKLFKAIESNSVSEVEDCIYEGVDVNSKHTDGGTPLHHAVNKGNMKVVYILLKNGADATQVTAKGNTPLHIATSKGHEEIVEVLLNHDESNNLVNAQTTVGGTASLHVAAKNGFIKIVKSLLKHGAIYDILNKDGKTPLDLSEHWRVTNILNFIKKLFKNAKNGDFEIISKLERTELDEFIALINTRNNEGDTLLQVAMNNKHKNITSEFFKLFRKPEQILSMSSPKSKLEQIAMLREVADVHIRASQLYLLELRSMTQSSSSTRNPSPSTTLKDGSYYLANAHSFVEIYKWCTNSSIIDNEYVQRVNDALIALEFDPKQITLYTDEVRNGQVECLISKGQGTRYYKLLHSELKTDVRLFVELVERDIDSSVKKFLESIKEKLQDVNPEKLFLAIETNSYEEVENCIKEGAFVNIQHTDGATPLHHAIHNGNIDIVNILLENDADITEVTDKDNTPLHTAACKGDKEIVELLLKHVGRDKLKDFINAQTVGGTTSLHIAAKNGSWDIVKSLLKHGAIYNVKNKEGKTPLELVKNRKITDLLKLASELFQDAKYGNPGIITKLKHRELEEIIVITNACNDQGNTLLQVAEMNDHKNIANMLSEMLKNPDQVGSRSIPKFNLIQIEKLKKAVESYIQCAESYLTMLRNSSQSNRSEKNSFPWATLKAGSYYLQNVHSFVEVYKECINGTINDLNIQAVNYILIELEFDPKHITLGYTDEAFGGKVECFVSKGQGTKYYELLHSDLKKDVRLFIEIVEPSIDIHVKKFFKSIKEELQLVLSEMLFGAIKNNDNLEVRNCLKEELVVNLKSSDGKIPLHYAIDNGNISIINTLLKHGADVTQLDYKGETPLHIASSKGNKRIIEVLLQHVHHEILNDFINVQTIVGGLTSLHIAAKNGSLEVVEFLLKHGAIYNIKNQECKTALDLSEDQNVTNLLKLIQTLFEDAKCGNFKIIRKLKTQPYKFTAITNTRNDQGKSLVQVAISNKHQALAAKIETVVKTRSNPSGC